jgi:anti-sigma-K factor RskA
MNRCGDIRFWRGAAGVLAVAVSALIVAAAIGRDRPDFVDRPVLTVIRDGRARPVWEIRLARAAHEIAARNLGAAPAPKSRAFELWLLPAGAATPRPLGILPSAGCEVIPVTPRDAASLAAPGALLVTLEPGGGAPDLRPSGPPMFRGRLHGMLN